MLVRQHTDMEVGGWYGLHSRDDPPPLFGKGLVQSFAGCRWVDQGFEKDRTVAIGKGQRLVRGDRSPGCVCQGGRAEISQLAALEFGCTLNECLCWLIHAEAEPLAPQLTCWFCSYDR